MADSTDNAKQTSNKVDAETARLEVKKFLDLKRVPATRRKKDFDASIETLEGMVQDGRLVFDFEKKRVTYKLLFSLERKESGKLSELSMRFFLGQQAADNALQKVDVGNVHARSIAIVGALSGISPDILRNAVNEQGEYGLDISDVNTLIHYTTFFLA